MRLHVQGDAIGTKNEHRPIVNVKTQPMRQKRTLADHERGSPINSSRGVLWYIYCVRAC